MALIKLSAGNDQYWLLNDVPHQRGAFDVKATIGEEVVEIFALTTSKSLARGKFSEFSPDGATPYASTQALIDDLKAFFFRSLSGGGGTGVTSVNGDPGPAVVLGSDDIPNESTVTGTTTSDALDELQQGVGANAIEIVSHVSNIGNPHQTNVSNLTDVTVSSPSNGEVLTWNGSQWINSPSSGFDPVTSGVLTEYIDSQNNNPQSTTAVFPSLVTYLTLVDTSIDINSDYRFNISFSIGMDTTNRNAVVDVKDFGVSILPQVYTVELQDTTNRQWVSLSGRLTPNPLGAGQIQLQLDFGKDTTGTQVTTMYFANISLQKINE